MAVLARSKLLVAYLALGVLAAGLVSFADAVAAIANAVLLSA